MSSVPHESTPTPPRAIHGSIKRTISGRYRGTTGNWQLELRLDVDGRNPMMMVSGDFYNIQEGLVSHFGSFIVNPVRVCDESANIIVEGQAVVEGGKNPHTIRITVPSGEQTAPVTVVFSSFTGSPEDTYHCHFESQYFRTVQLEQDYERTVTLFPSYNTGSLRSSGRARSLSVVGAYAEVGIEIQLSPKVNEIPSNEGNGSGDYTWDEAELHASMVDHFSLLNDETPWKVWLIAATDFIRNPDEDPVWGIMFDYEGVKLRQGCAIFHNAIKENNPKESENLRAQLYTYVHELGHCFNLVHPFIESFARSSAEFSKALSYMNYPGKYARSNDARVNTNAFWNEFPFQFEREEIICLRHAFRKDIIMGGSDFRGGSGFEALRAANPLPEPTQAVSGLELELRKPDQKESFAYGEPVVVELKLTTTEKRGKKAHRLLHPKKGLVQMAIRKPNDQIQSYRPLMQQCINQSSAILIDEKYPAIYDSAYIGYGKDGFYFDQPGLYYVQAEYHALDGSKLKSNILPINIHDPLSNKDREVGNLLKGPQQGKLLYLIGSDSKFLSKGNEALEMILKEHGRHFLADYPRFVKGFNQARSFKEITRENKVDIRKPNVERATELLTPVIKSSAADRGLDNITLSMTMLHLAYAQKLTGKKSDAENTVGNMVDIFKKKKLKPHVMELIETRANQII